MELVTTFFLNVIYHHCHRRRQGSLEFHRRQYPFLCHREYHRHHHHCLCRQECRRCRRHRPNNQVFHRHQYPSLCRPVYRRHHHHRRDDRVCLQSL